MKKLKIIMFSLSLLTMGAFAQVTGGEKLTAAAFNNKAEKFVPVQVRAHISSFNFGSFRATPYETEIIDTDNAFDGTYFTVPTGKAGLYYISANITANDSAVGFSAYFEIRISKNTTGGNISADTVGTIAGFANSTPYPAVGYSTIMKLQAGDTIHIVSHQQGGPSRTAIGDGRSSLVITQLTQD